MRIVRMHRFFPMRSVAPELWGNKRSADFSGRDTGERDAGDCKKNYPAGTGFTVPLRAEDLYCLAENKAEEDKKYEDL